MCDLVSFHHNCSFNLHVPFRIERPLNIYGSYGKSIKGEFKSGLVDTLRDLFLDKYIDHVTRGIPVKATILFCKKGDDLADLNNFLCDACPELASDPSCPWVVNLYGVGPVTAKSIRERKGEISLYLTTPVMLMGINCPNIEVVIMVRPFS